MSALLSRSEIILSRLRYPSLTEGLNNLVEAKQRPAYMPFSIMAIEEDIRSLVQIPEKASPFFEQNDTSITAIFKGLDTTPADILYKDSVAVRLPSSQLCKSIVEKTGPITATSANVHGKGAPMNVEKAIDQLGDKVSLYLDGGEQAGTPTSLVDFSTGRSYVIREGAKTILEVQAQYG